MYPVEQKNSDEFGAGALKNIHEANVTQAFIEGEKGILAVGQIPVTKRMRRDPGFYMLRFTTDDYGLRQELSFYIEGSGKARKNRR